MMVIPSVTKLLKNAENGYELVIVAARRARQISGGCTPLTDVKEESTVTLAANEIVEGKVYALKSDNDIESMQEVEEEVVEEVEV